MLRNLGDRDEPVRLVARAEVPVPEFEMKRGGVHRPSPRTAVRVSYCFILALRRDFPPTAIVVAVFSGDEPESLLVVEELHCARRHWAFLSLIQAKVSLAP